MKISLDSPATAVTAQEVDSQGSIVRPRYLHVGQNPVTIMRHVRTVLTVTLVTAGLELVLEFVESVNMIMLVPVEGTERHSRNSSKFLLRMGYTGAQCETDVDGCSSHPCQSGGQCVALSSESARGRSARRPSPSSRPQASGYACVCPPGLTGGRHQRGESIKVRAIANIAPSDTRTCLTNESADPNRRGSEMFPESVLALISEEQTRKKSWLPQNVVSKFTTLFCSNPLEEERKWSMASSRFLWTKP
ncbi:Protein crumbs-like protein 1 [Camelus dromedarius]|uniref:Protein crumbs-like protein 1 n=1 Tax=Camelus dromedarius TaxID=9838 RepID=A0A5N4CJK2_CAMDR|nr:Protein crumbs-like protein 1 [Camelus dromedarius]